MIPTFMYFMKYYYVETCIDNKIKEKRVLCRVGKPERARGG